MNWYRTRKPTHFNDCYGATVKHQNQKINTKNTVKKHTPLKGSNEPAYKPKESLFGNRIEEKWLSTSRAAAYLDISEQALRNMSALGKIKYYKLGSRNRYYLDDLKELLLSTQRGGSYEN